MATTSAQVQQLYVAYLGRAADKAGLDYWLNELNADNATLTLENLRANFVNEQAEYQDAYAGLTREDTVVTIYNNLFGRAPDAAGLEYWTTGAGATVNADQLLNAFIAGASATDAQVIANKVLVAEVYTSAAGTNYANADAKSVLAGVTSDFATVGTALVKLTDGSLSGIAVPAAVADLKAAAAADAAELNFESTNVATLKDVSTKLATLTKADANLTDTTATTATTYTAADGSVDGQLVAARAELGGDTKALTTAATTASTELAAARTALLTDNTNGVGAPAKIQAYIDAQAAVKAAPVAPTTAETTVATDTLTSIATNNTVEFGKALAAAGITSVDTATDVAALYAKLTDGATTDAVIANVAAEFNSVAAYGGVKATAAKAQANDKAADALVKATGDLNFATGNEFISKYDANVSAQSLLSSSKALDALESQYKAIDDAHTAVVTAADNATGKLDLSDSLVTTGASLALQAPADVNKAEVFYFASNKVTGADGALTLAAGGDKLYIGEGYTLNKAASLTDTGITGANNNAKEVFFFKGDDGLVKAVIESSVAGSLDVANTAALSTPAADNVSVITLTGVTDLAKVSFDSGVISVTA